MSTSYYLVQTKPTQLYGLAKVAQVSGGKPLMCTHGTGIGWVDGNLNWAGDPHITMPATVGDLKALVASGRYRLVDEYGKKCDVEKVFGWARS